MWVRRNTYFPWQIWLLTSVIIHTKQYHNLWLFYWLTHKLYKQLLQCIIKANPSSRTTFPIFPMGFSRAWPDQVYQSWARICKRPFRGLNQVYQSCQPFLLKKEVYVSLGLSVLAWLSVQTQGTVMFLWYIVVQGPHTTKPVTLHHPLDVK